MHFLVQYVSVPRPSYAYNPIAACLVCDGLLVAQDLELDSGVYILCCLLERKLYLKTYSAGLTLLVLH